MLSHPFSRGGGGRGGVFPSHRQKQGPSRSKHGGPGRLVVCVALCGVVLSTGHNEIQTKAQAAKAGLTNRPTEQTRLERRYLTAPAGTIPTGPACQNLGFLRS